ncbi:terminase small subunit [Mammaliicoccus sciuri]|uniref:terminase small subunit n=1 Tax=Mammaliicoccus sciuri TaxID=1296 RepID=UPI000E6A3322|nr:terminase small subunit [Mammaliicoccus sciuri]RIN79439.1 terminase small subunit [Mammaliicoccus sciuri]
MKLTRKQQLFADEYIRTGNASVSARNAGYSEAYAKTHVYKLLENARVKSYIDARLEELKKESIAEQDEILQYLTSVLRGKVKDEELMLVPTGDFMSEVERHEKRADIVARTKAAELLGKRYAMWTDKQEVEHSGDIIFVDDIE